jgi:asparagine synthase (glutamine-hydrolysing)
MCGIAGIINFNSVSVERQMLQKMNAFMAKRGPDGEGYWMEENIGFAHRRLSIIDLSENGKQPMEDINGLAVITYNGELYNYKALREELIAKNVKFHTNSDTEVIINGYLYWGIEELLLRMEGMFAFSLYDKKNKQVYICRDRFGKKPLYYYYNGRQILFASDIRSIHAIVSGLTIDYEALDYYLTELSVPQPKTIWNEIKQIRPAHYIAIDAQTGVYKELSYWSLSFNGKLNISVDEAINETEKQLTKAVLKRTVSDVPIGCFLSGGADSGLITAILASNSAERINTFSVGFADVRYNELPLAVKLAERYNTNHNEIIIEPNITQDLPAMVNGMGEPFADSSMVPSYYITKEIGTKVKVALSGDGGDEVFGGYYEYADAYLTDEYFNRNTSELKRKFLKLANYVAHQTKVAKINYGHLETYKKLTPAGKLFRQMGFTEQEKKKLYKKSELIESIKYSETHLTEQWESSNQLSITDTLFESSFKTRLVNDYLVKIDRMSMMNSIEVRSPFLDHNLVQFVAKLPNNIKLYKGINKYVIKKLAQKYIDNDFLSRKKQGFGIPIKHWLKSELKQFAQNILFSEVCKSRNIFNMEYVKHLVEEHENNNADHTHKIWALICLEMWFLQFQPA